MSNDTEAVLGLRVGYRPKLLLVCMGMRDLEIIRDWKPTNYLLSIDWDWGRVDKLRVDAWARISGWALPISWGSKDSTIWARVALSSAGGNVSQLSSCSRASFKCPSISTNESCAEWSLVFVDRWLRLVSGKSRTLL